MGHHIFGRWKKRNGIGAAANPKRLGLVFERLLVDVVDDQDGNGDFVFLFQLEAQLLVDCVEQRDGAAWVV